VSKTIYAELHVRLCTAELYLNGIPVLRNISPALPFSSIPVHQFLVPGANWLEVVVEPGPTPSRARDGESRRVAAGASVVARLVRCEEAPFTMDEPSAPPPAPAPVEGEKLAEITWNGDPFEITTFPRILAVERDLGPQAGRWSWQDAPPLCLDDATRAEIASVLATVAGAFEGGRSSGALDLLQTRFAEDARAYPVHDPRTLKAELVSSIRRAANEGWSVRPLDPARQDFRLCAGGRLVELVDRDWLPSLRFYSGATMGDEPAPDGEIPYAMMLARIAGRLVVVR
jgi:hypothetical protein